MKVSVIILNYNCEEYIKECLQSVFDNTYKDIEIIVVDNCSTDNSLDKIKGYGNKITLITNNIISGTAQTFNQGIFKAKGEYILFLVSDTRLDPNCIAKLVEALDNDSSIGISSAKMLYMDNHQQIDSVGEYINQYGFLEPRHKGHELEPELFNTRTEIFSCRGNSMMLRASLGLSFDENFYIMVEETDLCWRCWKRGYSVVFVPDAVIYHKVSHSLSKNNRLVKYYGARNYVKMLNKNLTFFEKIRVLPIHILLWFLLSFRTNNGKALRAGLWDLFFGQTVFKRFKHKTSLWKLYKKTRGY
ncbi:MAG: glycosyltransferase family 2 protein [Nanoarchaeota archaeon]|nr:glycosyltransferase family 2 protein [Nanoarchaeota archaeon]